MSTVAFRPVPGEFSIREGGGEPSPGKVATPPYAEFTFVAFTPQSELMTINAHASVQPFAAASVAIHVVAQNLEPAVVEACPKLTATREDTATTLSLRGSVIASVAEAPSNATLRVAVVPAHGSLYHGGQRLSAGDEVPAKLSDEMCGGGLAFPRCSPPNASDVIPDARVSTCADIVYIPDADYFNHPTVDAFGDVVPERLTPNPETFMYVFVLTRNTTEDAGGGEVQHVSEPVSATIKVVGTPDPPMIARILKPAVTSSNSPASEDGGDGNSHQIPIPAPLLSRVSLPGVTLADTDGDSFALLVRIESAMGNFVSLTSSPPEVLAACQNPFNEGDGTLNMVVEFAATPSVAAKLLAGLEYVHVSNSRAANGTLDVVTVTVTDGGCFHYDKLAGCPRQPLNASAAAVAAAAGELSSALTTVRSLRIEVAPYGGLVDMVKRHQESWHRSLLRSVPIAIGATLLAVWIALVLWGLMKRFNAWIMREEAERPPKGALILQGSMWDIMSGGRGPAETSTADRERAVWESREYYRSRGGGECRKVDAGSGGVHHESKRTTYGRSCGGGDGSLSTMDSVPPNIIKIGRV